MIGALSTLASSFLSGGGAGLLDDGGDTFQSLSDIDGRQTISFGSPFAVGGAGNSLSADPMMGESTGSPENPYMLPALIVVGALLLSSVRRK